MKRTLLTLIILIDTLLACHARSIMTDADSDPAAARWADSVYSTLTDRRRVGQLICGKAAASASVATVRRLVETDGVGALLFTSGSLAQYVALTNAAQQYAGIPVLMTFDGEWGLAMRVADTPRFPHNMALGAISDPDLLYRYGREMGRQCSLLGINVNFAPDVDVNSNPSNPVIGFRSFGENPARVAALGTAYSRGLEDAGVLSVAKHFPGHGDTSTDSHKQATVVNHSRARLDSVDLIPFRSYIDAGLSGIMVGHIAVPAVDSSRRPSSLSQAVTTGILRSDLGFRGLIFTDALEMKGARLPGHNSALEALLAGADVLLSSGNPAADISAIMAALADGRLSRETLRERCTRVLRYKYALGLSHRPAPLTLSGLAARIDSPRSRAVLDALACASVTVLRNRHGILPLGGLASRRIAVVNIGAPAANDFTDVCRRYATVDAFASPVTDALLARLRSYDVVIAAVYSDDAAARHAFGRVSDLPGLVSVFMLNPYKTAKFHAALGASDAIVLAYDNLPCTRQAAAMAVFGGITVSGRLPVNLPRLAPIGSGITIPRSRLGYSSPLAQGFSPALTDTIDSIVTAAMRAGAFPGAQVVVARHGSIVHQRAYGRTTASGPRVTDSTLYDLASVSKAAGTLPGIMKAVDLGLMNVDDTLGLYIPALRGTDKGPLTLRSLLYHQSGMPASLNMFNVMIDTASFTGRLITPRRNASHTIPIQRGAWGSNTARLRTDIVGLRRTPGRPVEAAAGLWVGPAAFDTIMGRIYRRPLRPGKPYNYSCLNFCLLMDAEQHATGIPHDRWVADSVWAPLGARTLTYRPSLRFPAAQIAPTEHDSFLRRQTVHGYVHDETAAFLGGVSGNAGMFGSAADLAKLCQMWLDGGKYGPDRILSPATVRLFTTDKSPTCRRGLGFDKPDTVHPENSPTCDEASPAVYGHLGFTGTVFWVDPENDMFLIFLTNRVNPTRDNAAFNRSNIRPDLFRALYRALL